MKLSGGSCTVNDIERSSASTTNPYSIGLSSSSRRSQSGLAFSTENYGLVDVFAQVFAQMSAPVADARGKDTTVDQSTSIIDTETKDYDRDNDVVSEDTKEPSDSARGALLQSLINVNQPVQVDAEATNVVDAGVKDAAVIDEAVTQTTGEGDGTSAKQPKSTSSVVDEDAQIKDLGLENTVNSSLDLGDDSRKSNRDAALTNSTGTETVETPDVGSSIRLTESDHSEVTDTIAEPELVDPVLASQTDSSDDRGSRRSSRRSYPDRDYSRGGEQSTVEAVSEKSVDTPQATAISVETPTSETTLEPQSSEPASSTVGAATTKPTVAPASAVVSVAAVGGAATARTAASSGSSSSDATAPIQSVGSAANPRSNGAEKTTSAKGNSADDAVTRAKLVQRVSRAFQHFGAEGGSIRLRLAPAELGSVRVEMQIQGGKVNARVVAETEAASTILRDHLADLRSRLESQGMQVESFEIETDEHSFSSSQDPYGQDARDSYQERSQDDRSVFQQRVAKLPVSRDVSYPVEIHDPVLLTAGVDAKF